MEIGVTEAVQERVKKTKISESKNPSLVFCWDTHLTKTKGRNVLFIVNASNRYTIAMTDIEPRNWNYYTMYISRVIHGVMQEMGYSEEQLNNILSCQAMCLRQRHMERNQLVASIEW